MIGSLFSGVDGLVLGLERATGLATAWQCEYDKAASKVLAERWPSVPNLHDITTVDWADVQPVEIVCGGFPCQPFSSAGRRKGTADERWMWPEFARCVRALRPRYVVVENVAALLADAGAFGAVLGDLAEAGYDARWTCLRAADVGAPHRRERLFLVAANAQRNRDGGQVLGGEAVGPVAFRSTGWPSGSGGAPSANSEYGDERRLHEGPAKADRSNGWRSHQGTPGERAQAPDRHVAPDARGPRAGRDTGAPSVAEEPSRWGPPDNADAPLPGGATAPDAQGHKRRQFDRDGVCAWGAYEPAIRRWESIHGPAPAPVDERGRLSSAFVEWMMGFPFGWVTDTPISRSAQLRCLGNAVVPHCAERAWHLLSLVEVAP